MAAKLTNTRCSGLVVRTVRRSKYTAYSIVRWTLSTLSRRFQVQLFKRSWRWLKVTGPVTCKKYYLIISGHVTLDHCYSRGTILVASIVNRRAPHNTKTQVRQCRTSWAESCPEFVISYLTKSYLAMSTFFFFVEPGYMRKKGKNEYTPIVRTRPAVRVFFLLSFFFVDQDRVFYTIAHFYGSSCKFVEASVIPRE